MYYRSLPSHVSDTLTILFLPPAITNISALLRSAGCITHMLNACTETHALTQFHVPSGPQLQHVTEKQLFSTGPMGWLSARLLMTSIWGNHRFPVALIKSRLIKTFAIHPVLSLQVVFFSFFWFFFDPCLSFLLLRWVLLHLRGDWSQGITAMQRSSTLFHHLSLAECSQTAAKSNTEADTQMHLQLFHMF